ncbi:MAG: Bax inhibitor-1/YccA family protein [Bacteroidales bacterium]|nr:Bax inhibitor-1/YccA family protein [Bacteroidales bacterium]
MANPVLNDTLFKKSAAVFTESGTMTVKGTMTKALLLLLLVIAAGAYTWKIFYEAINPASISGWMWGGVIVGFICAMVISFKPNTAPFLSPVYAAAEGLVLGAVSAIYNSAFAETAPNIISNAVILTLLCALVMLTIYRTGIIKVNGTFARVITVSLITIFIFYMGSMLLSMFGVNLEILHGSSPLSIGISVLIVGIAAFSLLMDYKFIEQASVMGAPKQMEWYGAFGLMVTLVWLYLEILKLLGKINSRE